MALSRLTDWNSGDVLTDTALEAEFDNIYNDALSLVSPLTGDLAFGSNKATGIASGSVSSPALQIGGTTTGPYSSAASTLDVAAGGIRAARFNTAAGGVNFLDLTPAATGSGPIFLATGSDTDVNANYNTKGAGIHVFKIGNTAAAEIANILTAKSFLYSDANKALATTNAPTNGQLLIGSTGNIPALAALTAGIGSVTITNGAGTITIGTNIITKSADQTINNSAVLTNDTHLVFAMTANTSYFFNMLLLITGANATADFKCGWTVPVAATAFWGPDHLATGSGTSANYFGPMATNQNPDALLTESGSLAIATIAGITGLRLQGIVRNGANAGDLQFQWSQNTQGATDLKVLKDSFMVLGKIQ